VISISYSSYELSFYPDELGYMQAFDVTAMGLGAMGVTILSAAGDDGACLFIVDICCRLASQLPFTHLTLLIL
jgi:hypothetical protein